MRKNATVCSSLPTIPCKHCIGPAGSRGTRRHCGPLRQRNSAQQEAGGMETADYFRQKAAQCRRLAEGIVNQNDPVVATLLALAVEFEARAVALTAEQASDKQVEQIPPKSE